MKFLATAIRNVAKNEENIKIVQLIIFLLCAADASFLPMPAQTLLLIVLMMYPSRAFGLFIASFAGTMTGALSAYLVASGLVMNTSGGLPALMNFMSAFIAGFSEFAITNIQSQFHLMGPQILFGASFTPIPYGLFAITSGAMGYSLPGFLIITIIGQGIKFYLLILLATKPGQWLKRRLKSYLSPFAVITLTFFLLMILIP
jgi:membrane protein YqaA with SNARE-associated domain